MRYCGFPRIWKERTGNERFLFYRISFISSRHGQRQYDSSEYLLYGVNSATFNDRQKERACGDRLSPKQINISVLIIARGKEKANGKYKDQ